MRLTSIVAIYMLFWAFSFFLVLPFRPRVKGAEDRPVPGQMPGAPPPFSFGRACLWTTVVSVLLFGLYYLNYVESWLPVQALDMVHGDAGMAH